MTTDEKCTVCHQTRQWHEDHNPRHRWNATGAETFGKKGPDGDRKPLDTGESVSQQVQWPFDPVLRQALMDKGVLEPDDLINAEKKIRAATATWEGMVQT